MTLPACLTEHRPLVEWNGHAQAPYVEAILTPVKGHPAAVHPLATLCFGRRVWLQRKVLEIFTQSGAVGAPVHATILREADELPL